MFGISTLINRFGAQAVITALAIALGVSLVMNAGQWFNTYAVVKLGPIGHEGWKPKALKFEAALDKVAEAQVQARKAAEEAKAATEQEYRDLAERTDNATIERLEDELGRAERFIAANRVCPADRGSPGRTAATAGNNGTGNSDGPGAASELDGVIVEAEDVRICTENTVRLESAREWALELAGD